MKEFEGRSCQSSFVHVVAFKRYLPVVIFQTSILVGLSLMSFYFFVEFVQWLDVIFVKKSIPEEMLSSRKEIESWI